MKCFYIKKNENIRCDVVGNENKRELETGEPFDSFAIITKEEIQYHIVLLPCAVTAV